MSPGTDQVLADKLLQRVDYGLNDRIDDVANARYRTKLFE